jgi:phytanoyl-CoA hydroxylase
MNTSTVSPRSITPEQVAQFHRDGFLVVPSLYSGEQMLGWKATLQAVLEEEKKQAGDAWNLTYSGVRVWNSQEIHPKILQAMKDERVTPILQQVIGPNVEFLSAKVVFKNDTTSFASPWHQDWFYWEGARKISVWIAMDDAVVANGCLKFIPGSNHKVFPKTVSKENAFTNRIADKDLEGWQEITAEVTRGSAVFFGDLAIHSSHPNVSKADRWSLISTYRDAGVKDECGLNASLWKEPTLVCGKSVNGGK